MNDYFNNLLDEFVDSVNKYYDNKIKHLQLTLICRHRYPNNEKLRKLNYSKSYIQMMVLFNYLTLRNINKNMINIIMII